jgi:hypothetical protein
MVPHCAGQAGSPELLPDVPLPRAATLPMDATHTLLFVIAIQLSLACVGWWLAGTVLGLSRAASRHWSAFCLLGLVAAAAGWLSNGPRDAAPLALANLALVGAFVALTRGVGFFLGQRPSLWLVGACLGAMLLLGAWDLAVGGDPNRRSLLVSAAAALVLLRGGWRNARQVQAEFGPVLAALVAGPCS